MTDKAEAEKRMASHISAECDRLLEEVIWGGPSRKAAAENAYAESVYPPKRPEYPKLVPHIINGKIMWFIEHGMFHVDAST